MKIFRNLIAGKYFFYIEIEIEFESFWIILKRLGFDLNPKFILLCYNWF